MAHSGPWSRTDWNDIIRRINTLCSNPDPGCAALPLLDEVDENHIWSKDDITRVRNKLTEICQTNQFTEVLKFWKQQVIDEIEEAITRGWCDCCNYNDIQITVATHSYISCTVSSECPYESYYYPTSGWIDLNAIIRGLQVSDGPGSWRLYIKNNNGTNSAMSLYGVIDDNGYIVTDPGPYMVNLNVCQTIYIYDPPFFGGSGTCIVFEEKDPMTLPKYYFLWIFC